MIASTCDSSGRTDTQIVAISAINQKEIT